MQEGDLNLAEAINAEDTTEDVKQAQLAILKNGPNEITQEELNAIIQGGFERSSYSGADREALKDLAIYRIQHNLNMHPFSEHQGEVGPCFY